MIKIIFLLSITLLTVLYSNAQGLKKGCNPASCSPDNTKIEEAAVVTDLRKAIAKKKSSLIKKGLMGNKKIAIGIDEEESLYILTQELNKLESLLGKNQTEFVDYTGAKLVQKLNEALELLD